MAERPEVVTSPADPPLPFSPAPPLAAIALPWDELQSNPIRSIAEARAAHGDTFAVHSGASDYLFVFDATGVKWFYDVEEAEASKGVADWRMLLRKLPDELFLGRRTFPHELFGRDDVAKYREALGHAIDDQCAELGDAGTVDAFELTRRLGHRLGLASWGGRAFTRSPYFDELVRLFDALDGSDAFVRPDLTTEILASGKAAERKTLDQLAARIVDIAGVSTPETSADERLGFDQIRARWSVDGVDPDSANTGAALDLILVHIGSMSNLFAAIGWLLIDTAVRPELRSRALEDPQLLERCALESVRLGQRSIMLREVVAKSVEVHTGAGTFLAQRGTTIATLLPLTNVEGADLDDYRPERWSGRRLGSIDDLAARELVTTFGHGKHTCPAQPFSLYAMTEATRRLNAVFTFTAEFDRAEPRRVQIGGVARAENPCPLAYTRDL